MPADDRAHLSLTSEVDTPDEPLAHRIHRALDAPDRWGYPDMAAVAYRADRDALDRVKALARRHRIQLPTPLVAALSTAVAVDEGVADAKRGPR